MRAEARFKERLDTARAEGRYRSLCGLRPRSIDLSSNDYLGFSNDPELRDRVLDGARNLPLGSGGSRLLRGTLEIHSEVEKQLAAFCGSEASLLFPSGYQANLGLLTALLSDKDQVFSDASNHASLVDGIRLSRAQKFVFKHNDLSALKQLLDTSPTGERNNPAPSASSKWIVVESLYSMDGDFAPLQELADLAEIYGAKVIVDESHATGLYGDIDAPGSVVRGGGLVQATGLRERVAATIHTGGKALGTGGAWIGCSALLREFLINFSRPFIFSTAPIPYLALSLSCAIEHWTKCGSERAKKVRKRAQESRMAIQATRSDSRQISLTTVCSRAKPAIEPYSSPIVPIIVGSNDRAIALSEKFRISGFDIRAIRPPTVPTGTSRLRVTVTCNPSDEEWQNFLVQAPHLLESCETTA